MTIRRIVMAYLAASLVVVIAGSILKEIPLVELGGVAYAFVWIVLGPLISLFYVVREWQFALFHYPIGSALLVPGLALILHRGRIVRLIGYVVTVIMWAAGGFLALAGAWGG